MSTANQECIWKEQCGGECSEQCSDYTPIDDSESKMKFYFNILSENAQEYQEVIDDYSDGEVDC